MTLAQTAFLVSVSVLTMALNSLVIMTIWKDPFKQLKGTANYLILNLAVCDLLMGFPTELLFAILHWFPGNKSVIKAGYITMYFAICASFLTILGLAVERLIVISSAKSDDNSTTTSYCTVGIMSIWLFAALTASLPMLGWDSFDSYRLFIADAIGVPVLILLFACYTRIFLLIRKQLHRYFATGDQRRELQPLTPKSQRMERLKRRERGVALSVFILTGLVTVCWSPLFIVENIRQCCDHDDCIPKKLDLIFESLIFVHPLANPIAYALRTAKFRRALKRIFRRSGNN